MCSPCYEWRRKQGLIQVQKNRLAEFIEDVEWMISTGETHIEAVARRLETNPENVRRRLERHSRYDLTRRLQHSTAEGRAV
jgi:signal transduction histidine kinase